MDPASRPPSSEPPTGANPPRFFEAAHAVLSTNELLCEIIGRPPLEDVVVTTGVCRTWRNALKASVAIQQALFLIPAGIQEITTTTKCLSMRVEDIPRKQYAVIGEPHPWTARICGKLSARGHQTTIHMLVFGHPAGTWREMFITQPPTKALELSFYGSVVPRPKTPDGYISCYKKYVPYNCAEGIKLGPLHDFIELALQGRAMPSFATMLVPNGFFAKRSFSVSSRYNRWWQVHNGEVHRRIQPPNNVIDITGDVTDTEDHQMPVWPKSEFKPHTRITYHSEDDSNDGNDSHDSHDSDDGNDDDENDSNDSDNGGDVTGTDDHQTPVWPKPELEPYTSSHYQSDHGNDGDNDDEDDDEGNHEDDHEEGEW